MPTPRHLLAVAAVDNKVYAIGGVNSSVSGGTYHVNEEYDPSTNTWTTKADMPTPRCYITAAVVDGKIYIIAGSNNAGGLFSDNEVYDPVTDAWSTRMPCPHPRHSYGIGVVNGKIYVIGGWDGSASTTLNEEYDPVTNTWSTKAPMPTARNGLTVAVLDNRIYAIGGAINANPWTNTLNIVEEYDPVINIWNQSVSPVPTPRSFSSSATIANDAYVIGGANDTDLLGANEKFTVKRSSVITLTPSSGIAVTTVAGSGFSSYSKVTLNWDGVSLPTVPSSIITDAYGQFTAIISVPTQTVPGTHIVNATDDDSNWATATFTVVNMTGPQGPSGNVQELMILIAFPTVASILSICIAIVALLRRKP